jgi:hypothetical protein
MTFALENYKRKLQKLASGFYSETQEEVKITGRKSPTFTTQNTTNVL